MIDVSTISVNAPTIATGIVTGIVGFFIDKKATFQIAAKILRIVASGLDKAEAVSTDIQSKNYSDLLVQLEDVKKQIELIKATPVVIPQDAIKLTSDIATPVVIPASSANLALVTNITRASIDLPANPLAAALASSTVPA
jgi:translation elongation factor EF-Tu-like GTPase